MKKALLIGSLGMFGVIALASCKKDYTCECTSSVGGITAGTSSVTITDTKKKAEDQCVTSGASATVGGVTTSTTCAIVN